MPKAIKPAKIQDFKALEDMEPQEYLRQLLMSDEGCISLEDARKEPDKKFPEKA
jgi:hypothetical protein